MYKSLNNNITNFISKDIKISKFNFENIQKEQRKIILGQTNYLLKRKKRNHYIYTLQDNKHFIR